MTSVKAPNLKISIIIPTRNRAEYLEHCIASCLLTDDPNIEVIVSNNNSADNTESVVASFQDSRLKYYNTGEDISMRANWEFGLKKSTGDYVVLIGDDDGFYKNGLDTLRHIIDKHEPDVITWRQISYFWPQKTGEKLGLLKLKLGTFFGPLEIRDARQMLKEYCSAKVTNYIKGANIYHGCVSRKVIDHVKTKSSTYFMAFSPDVYAAIANLTASKKIYIINHRLSIGGMSKKSNGMGFSTRGKVTADQRNVMRDFLSLGSKDSISPEVDFRIKIVSAHSYSILNRINAQLMDNKLSIDHNAWRKSILKDINNYPESHVREANLILIQKLFAKLDPSYQLPTNIDFTTAEKAAGSWESTDVRDEAATKKSKRYIPDSATHNISHVAEWLDIITGGPHIYIHRFRLPAYAIWLLANVKMFTRMKLKSPQQL